MERKKTGETHRKAATRRGDVKTRAEDVPWDLTHVHASAALGPREVSSLNSVLPSVQVVTTFTSDRVEGLT